MRNTWQLLHSCYSVFNNRKTAHFVKRAVGLEMGKPDIRTLGHGFEGKVQGEECVTGETQHGVI